MSAASRATKPVVNPPCDCPDSQLPSCLPETEKTLDEVSLRALMTLFELLDRWDREGNHEA